MNSGLPLEVLGLLSPILSWVEDGDRHGPSRLNQRNKFSINRHASEWLKRELPTYSYDTLDEIREAAFDSRHPCDNADVSGRFHLIHMLRKLSAYYFEWRGNKLCIKENRVVELHELSMRFPVQHLVRYLHVDAVARGYISMEHALELPPLMNKLDTTYQGMCTLVNRGLTEGHLHLGGVLGAEETWADRLFKWLSPRKNSRDPENFDCFIQLGRIAVRLLATGLLYQYAIPYGNTDSLSREILPFHLIRRLDNMYMNRDLLKDPREHTLLFRQWYGAFTREFEPAVKPGEDNGDDDKKQDGIEQDGKEQSDKEQEKAGINLGQVPWKQMPHLAWLLELANPGMAGVWFQDPVSGLTISPASGPANHGYNGKNVRPTRVRDRIRLLNRLHLTVQEFLVKRNRRKVLKNNGPTHKNGPKQCNSPEMEGWGRSPFQQVEDFINQVFTRYLIYHTHYWKQATQGGKTTGLRHFQEFYDAPERLLAEEERGESEGLALERLTRFNSLRQLEGRLTPPSRGPGKYIPWLLAFARQAKRKELDKFGIVVHFKKAKHGKISEKGEAIRKKYGIPDHVKRQVPNQRYFLRCGEIRRETRGDAFKLFRLLSSAHPVVPFIVGIDAASLELTTPPEVFAPAFHFLKAYPIEIRKCGTTRAYFERHDHVTRLVNNRLLGMTYHVGEDFRHLLSGLRAIHEVIEYLHPQPGDRLGHAIALGLDPGDWGKQMGYHAVVPKQEWLDTLVWAHNFLGVGNNLIGELGIEDRIQYFARKIYGSTRYVETRDIDLYCNPITLYDSWRLRQIDPYSVENNHPHDVERPQRCEEQKRRPGEHRERGGPVDDRTPRNHCFSIPYRGDSPWKKRWLDVQKKQLKRLKDKVGSDGAYLLTKLYWFCPGVAEEGRKPITIDMMKKKTLWVQLCRQAQEKLKRIVRERHLVVEVNPSSNRIIGPMASMQEHPVFRLTLDKEGRPVHEGRVTINTDDPGVFATSLSHEFFLLGEVLLDRGIPETEVMAWLEWLRKNGSDYSFLRTLPDCKDERVRDILECLEDRYRPLARSVKDEPRRYMPPKSRIKQKRPVEEEFNRLKARLLELERKYEGGRN